MTSANDTAIYRYDAYSWTPVIVLLIASSVAVFTACLESVQ